MRHLDLQWHEARHGTSGHFRCGAGRHAGRYVLAAAERALLDPSVQPWVALPDGDVRFETQPADYLAFLGSFCGPVQLSEPPGR
jgi:hypothetical protein